MALCAGAVQLISPPFAACHAGVGYYAALVNALKTDFPALDFTLCCGDDPAMAHEALRRGFRSVVCDAGTGQLALEALAGTLAARVLREYPVL